MKDNQKPPMERKEVVEILFELIKEYDGFHESSQVKGSMPKSPSFKKLVDYVNKHYTDNDYITSCLV